MRISFQTNPPPLEDLDGFELVHPKPLRTKQQFKARALADGQGVWLFVDGELAGEIYGVPVASYKGEIPDTLPSDFYVAKLTILPKYWNLSLGRLLLAHMTALLKEKRVSWHSTTKGMQALSDFFGAKIGPTHPNWFGTGKPAVFRYLEK